ncbi:hypothetical protein M8J76_013020 [Diaphorina citri]|nr:hypothetical protein M8J76_013020 [Diaphorina citri]
MQSQQETFSEVPPLPPSDQLLELKWANFQSSLAQTFAHLRQQEDLVDVTLVCDGQRLYAHKLVLCAASPWFKSLLMENPCKHPIIILNEGYHHHMSNILDYIYSGHVRIPQNVLSEFLHLAQCLQIKGLTDPNDIDRAMAFDSNSTSPTAREKHKLSSEINGLAENSDSYVGAKKSRPPSQDFETSPEQLPYAMLEPKLEILDDQVDYSECSGVGSTYDRTYNDSQLPSTGYNIKHPPLSTPGHSASSQHNSLQDLMNITGRLKEIQPVRNSNSYPSIEPDPSVYNASREDYVDNPARYSTSECFNLKPPPDLSVVPYLPLQHDTPSYRSVPGGSKPLHSLDARYCKICGKHYSNSSNLKQHIRLIHLPGILFCPLCQKCFKNKLYLRRHVISFHENAT